MKAETTAPEKTRLQRLAWSLADRMAGFALQARPSGRLSEWFGRIVALAAPQNVFLAIAGVAGLILVFVIPPYQTADENVHFYRSAQVSEGRMTGEVLAVWTGGRLPAGLFTLAIQQELTRIIGKPNEKTSRELILKGLDVAWGDRIEIGFPNSAIYPPTNYMPQAAAIALARAAGGGPLIAMYAGRLGNLLFFLGLTWFAIRLMPYGAITMAAVALFPITIYQASTLSCDTVLNALSFLFLALSLRAAETEDGRLAHGRWGLRLVIGAMVAAGKSVYAPLIAIGFIRAFSDPRERRLRVLAYEGAIVLFGLLATYLWYSNNTEHMISVNSNIVHIDHKGQFAFVLEDPIRFLKIVALTSIEQAHVYLATTIGVLGWLDTLLPNYFYRVLPLVLLLFLLSGEPEANRRPCLLRLGAIALCAAVVFAIFLSLYLSWTELHGQRVSGVSGRYLIPLLPMAAIAFAWPRIPYRHVMAPQRLLLAGIGVFMASGTIHTVINRFY